MSNAQLQRDSGSLATHGLDEQLTRLLCWFAAFPYAAYTQISTPTSRARVMANGIAVIVSSLVFALALLKNGSSLVGNSPYLYLLPLVVFAIERLLVALSYQLANNARLLIAVRIAIILISASFAVFAGLLSESESLIQRLHKAEDTVTMRSAEAQNLATRVNSIDEQIARNENELMTRDAIETERLDAIRLRDMECHGKGGVDPNTGTFVKGGGKCGVNAETHRINAEAAEARLAKLARLDNDNKGFVALRHNLKNDLNALLESKRSPPDSLGSLGRAALNEADFGLRFKIGVLILIVLVIETSALVMSKIQVSQTLQMAVQVSDEIDQIRLKAWREAASAEVAKQRASQRIKAADGLAPLEVTLTAAPKKSDVVRDRQHAEDKTEELV